MNKTLTAATDRPSGLVLPLILRQSHQINDTKVEHDSARGRQLRRADFLARSYTRDRQWTVASIEQALKQTWEAAAQVQRQIQRGEETYYDESQVMSGACNIFRGWDQSFIDVRLNGELFGRDAFLYSLPTHGASYRCSQNGDH
jgi:hypothetical protein